jgi:aspartate racemase
MKTIGLVGGTGWISTAEYYRIINEEVNRRLGGMNFARCVLYSLDYGEIDELQKRKNPEGICSLLLDASKKLVSAGAECVLLCANTMHMYAERVQETIPVPLIHIAAATARQIKKRNLKTVGLLGTKMTMEQDFYKKRLNQEGITVLIPEQEERAFIHRTIDSELLKGVFLRESKDRFLEIIRRLQSRGAEGIVLGCTEIPLLIKQEDLDFPLFNTTVIHSLAAVDFALGKSRPLSV